MVKYHPVTSTPFACYLYGKVGVTLKGAISVKREHIVPWLKALKSANADRIDWESDDKNVVLNAAIFILDRSDQSDVTNGESVFSIECTPMAAGSATITVTYGDIRVPVTFFIHAEDAP